MLVFQKFLRNLKNIWNQPFAQKKTFGEGGNEPIEINHKITDDFVGLNVPEETKAVSQIHETQ